MLNYTEPESFGESPIVDIYVGAKRKLFRYHKVMLCQGAPYFATSLKDDWNGKALQLELPDVDIDTFVTVTEWIYMLSKPAEFSAPSETFVIDIARLYKFVDYLMMEQEKNELIDRLIAYLSTASHVTFRKLDTMYALGLSATKLFSLSLRNCGRHFLYHGYPYLETDESISSSYEEIQNPVVLALMLDCIAQYYLEKWSNPTSPNCRKHHDHISTPRCTKPTVNDTSSVSVRSGKYLMSPLTSPTESIT